MFCHGETRFPTRDATREELIIVSLSKLEKREGMGFIDAAEMSDGMIN